jgi:tight adherence protein C
MWFILTTVFISVFLLTFAASFFIARHQRVRERVETDLARSSGLILEKPNPFKEKVLGWLSYTGRWATGNPERMSQARQKLLHAGYRHQGAPAVFFGSRVLAALLLPLPALLIFIVKGKVGPINLLFAFVIATLGFFLPSIVLDFKVQKRHNRLDKALPDIIDLLVICIEAGLALNAALQRVAEEIRSTYQDFYDELQITCAELRTGIAWEEAFDNLGKRTGLQSIRSLVGMLIQTEKLGASIGQALRNHGEFTRTQRLLRVEEKAAKLPVKIVIPLVLCILPAMFCVILGPAVVHVIAKFLIIKYGR